MRGDQRAGIDIWRGRESHPCEQTHRRSIYVYISKVRALEFLKIFLKWVWISKVVKNHWFKLKETSQIPHPTVSYFTTITHENETKWPFCGPTATHKRDRTSTKGFCSKTDTTFLTSQQALFHLFGGGSVGASHHSSLWGLSNSFQTRAPCSRPLGKSLSKLFELYYTIKVMLNNSSYHLL